MKIKKNAVPNVGLSALVADLLKVLDDVETKLGPVPLALTSAEKRRIGKIRKGGDQIVRTIAPLANQYGLNSASLDADTMSARLADAQTLLPLQQKIDKVSKRVSDLIFRAHADSWLSALEFYALLRRRAATDGDVAAAVASIQAFFAYRHPSVASGQPGKRKARADAKAKAALKQLGVDVPKTVDTPGTPASDAPPPATNPAQAAAPTQSSPPPPAPPGVNGVTNGVTQVPPNGGANAQLNGHA